MDYSTKVGGRIKQTGNDRTAGNSSGPSRSRKFKTSKTTAVKNKSRRYARTRTRRG